MATKEYWIELRKKRKEAGLCLSCGRAKDDPKHLRHVRMQLDFQREKRLGKQAQKRQATWRRRFLLTYKLEHACIRCGEDHMACLEFHHRVPAEKKFEITSPKAMSVHYGVFKREFEKCDLLCANCHRKIHYGDRRTTMCFKPKPNVCVEKASETCLSASTPPMVESETVKTT